MDSPPRKHLKRYERSHDLRFLTFSTYRRVRVFDDPAVADLFARHLERVRQNHRFRLYAWMIMPEHVHLIIWPRLPASPVRRVLMDLKRVFSRDLLEQVRRRAGHLLERLTAPDGEMRVWQAGGGYDRNIYGEEERIEKTNYIHQNPVTRGLVAKPIDWPWSSARWYARQREGAVVRCDDLPPRKPDSPGGTA
jgi:putative transposase